MCWCSFRYWNRVQILFPPLFPSLLSPSLRYLSLCGNVLAHVSFIAIGVFFNCPFLPLVYIGGFPSCLEHNTRRTVLVLGCVGFWSFVSSLEKKNQCAPRALPLFKTLSGSSPLSLLHHSQPSEPLHLFRASVIFQPRLTSLPSSARLAPEVLFLRNPPCHRIKIFWFRTDDIFPQ